MDQRINLQYSINIDELPSEVQRLIDKCADQLYESYETINELRAHDQLFTLNTVQKLDTTRKKTFIH